MKTEAILARVHEILEYSKLENSSMLYISQGLFDLETDLEAQMREEAAKSRGCGNAQKVFNAMLKGLKKAQSGREAMHYAWMDDIRMGSDGFVDKYQSEAALKGKVQCVCDGFRAFRMYNPVPMENRPEGIAEPLNLNTVFPGRHALDGYTEIPLPDVNELKSHISIQRAKIGKPPKNKYLTDVKKTIFWDFGDDLPVVNAQYLLDLMTVLPNANVILFNPAQPLGPLYAHDEHGESILLPCRKAAKEQSEGAEANA